MVLFMEKFDSWRAAHQRGAAFPNRRGPTATGRREQPGAARGGVAAARIALARDLGVAVRFGRFGRFGHLRVYGVGGVYRRLTRRPCGYQEGWYTSTEGNYYTGLKFESKKHFYGLLSRH